MGYYNVVMDMQDLISMILRCTEGNITAGPGLAASWLYLGGGVTESLSQLKTERLSAEHSCLYNKLC